MMNTIVVLLTPLILIAWLAQRCIRRGSVWQAAPAETRLDLIELLEYPKVTAAIEEARRQWPEFLTAWQEHGDSNYLLFAVRGPVSSGENTRSCWLKVASIENEVVSGELIATPTNLGELTIRSGVSLPVSALHDWLYVDHGRPLTLRRRCFRPGRFRVSVARV